MTAPPASPEPAASRPTVLAVVVTYFPGEDFPGSLTALRGQADAVVVIDNASAEAGKIERLALAAGCRFIGNAANLGVAAALNQAARLAAAEGYEWLATFDQDSLVPAGAIAGLFDLLAAHPDRHRIGVLAMSHRDRNTGHDYQSARSILRETPTWRELRATITSGAMVRMAALGNVGAFDEGLFIDGVDHDFCLRCRRHGLLVIEGRDQILDHAIGAATEARILGRRVTPTHHSPDRRYYITRNGLEMCRRHLTTDLGWAAAEFQGLIAGNVRTLLVEDRRAAKAWAMLQGAWHFAIRRFGPRPRTG